MTRADKVVRYKKKNYNNKMTIVITIINNAYKQDYISKKKITQLYVTKIHFHSMFLLNK